MSRLKVYKRLLNNVRKRIIDDLKEITKKIDGLSPSENTLYFPEGVLYGVSNTDEFVIKGITSNGVILLEGTFTNSKRVFSDCNIDDLMWIVEQIEEKIYVVTQEEYINMINY